MDCRNCGANMELFERRRYFYCHHCGAFHFIDAPEYDGVRPLEPVASGQACPVCAAALVRALLDNQYAVEHCRHCRGVLMMRRDFGEVVTRRRRNAGGPGEQPPPVDARELERHIRCPSCGADMETHPYYGPGNVIIDTCSRCDVLWLDRGELTQITDATGRDRGR